MAEFEDLRRARGPQGLRAIDVNADLGEGAGHDAELLAIVSSANIACGVHAGDEKTMAAVIREAQARQVAIGAHPGLPDRATFGRGNIDMAPSDVFALVVDQLQAFARVAAAVGARPDHVKPHGALYTASDRDEAFADAIARAIVSVDPDLMLFAPARGELAAAARRHGIIVAREVFADRNYLSDGSLVPRSRPDALLHDPDAAAARVLRMLEHGTVRAIDGNEVPVDVDTICVHGDTPDAAEFARVLRVRLEAAGLAIAPVGRSRRR